MLILFSFGAIILIRFVLAMILLTLIEREGENNYVQQYLIATLTQWFIMKNIYTERVNRLIRIHNTLSIILLFGLLLGFLFYILIY